MDTEKFDYFLVLSEVLNFTKASQILHKSPSVLSRQIASLEDELGFALFIRDCKSCTLTKAGAHMRNGVENIKELLQKLIAESKEIEAGRWGRLSIAVPDGEANGHYYKLFKDFTDNYPNTELTFTAYKIKELVKHLNDNTIDIAFSVSSNPWFSSISRPEYNHINVGVRNDCLYLPKDHPLASRKAEELTLSDFRDETFLVLKWFETNLDVGPTVKTFARHGFRPKFKMVDDLSDLIVSLQNRQGICIGSNRLLMYSDPQFKKLYLSDLMQHTEIIMWSQDNPNPCINSFVYCVKRYFQQHPNFSKRDNVLDMLI